MSTSNQAYALLGRATWAIGRRVVARKATAMIHDRRAVIGAGAVLAGVVAVSIVAARFSHSE